jgi:hypothetical protein
MSLVSFIELEDVAARLKPFRGAIPKAEARLLVPSSGNPQLAGTAFDYLLRFELNRRAPHAKVRAWVAEGAPFLLSIRVVDPSAPPDLEGELEAHKRSTRVSAVCRSAKKLFEVTSKTPLRPPTRNRRWPPGPCASRRSTVSCGGAGSIRASRTPRRRW